MKDVQACEKRGGAGNGALIPRYPNGETRPFTDGFRRASARQNTSVGNESQMAFGVRQHVKTNLMAMEVAGTDGGEPCVKGHHWLNT
jgi:hypothetical protein